MLYTHIGPFVEGSIHSIKSGDLLSPLIDINKLFEIPRLVVIVCFCSFNLSHVTDLRRVCTVHACVRVSTMPGIRRDHRGRPRTLLRHYGVFGTMGPLFDLTLALGSSQDCLGVYISHHTPHIGVLCALAIAYHQVL